MKEFASDEFLATVTCRVLKLARQPYYRWLAVPVTAGDLQRAHLANALFDAHREDPEFGHRLLADQAREAGQQLCGRTAWRVCRDNRWCSAFGKKRGKNGKRQGPPAHEPRAPRLHRRRFRNSCG